MGLTCSTIFWVRSGEVAIVYRFSDHRNRLYILVSSISSVMQHSRSNVECTPSRWLHWFYSHLKWRTEKKDNKGKGPTPSTASVRPLIKSGWNPNPIDRYICLTDIHHSNQNHQTLFSITNAHNSRISQELVKDIITVWLIPWNQETSYMNYKYVLGWSHVTTPEFIQTFVNGKKKLRASCWTSSTSTSCCTSSSPKSSS